MSDLATQLARALSAYSGEVAAEVKTAVDEVSAEMLARIKANAPKKTGDYRKKMKLKTTYEDRLSKRKLWYVAAPDYRLAHLLEHGHETKEGGFVLGRPHIGPAEEQAKVELKRRVERAVQHASK